MMGFRFRRSIKIAPGVRLNFSKSGVSTSLGVRGAHVTIGHGKVRQTVGLPGTGISYSETHEISTADAREPKQTPGAGSTIGSLVLLVLVLSVVLVLGYACGVAIR